MTLKKNQWRIKLNHNLKKHHILNNERCGFTIWIVTRKKAVTAQYLNTQ